MTDFRDWIRVQAFEDPASRDFRADYLVDEDAPAKVQSFDELERYLDDCGACEGAMRGAARVWRWYQHDTMVQAISDFGDGDWTEAYQHVQSLTSLPDDWDKEGARSPTARTVAIARRLLERCQLSGSEAPTRIVPTPMGLISIEWESATDYWEAEINGSDVVAWLRETEDGSFEEWNELVLLPQHRSGQPVDAGRGQY